MTARAFPSSALFSWTPAAGTVQMTGAIRSVAGLCFALFLALFAASACGDVESSVSPVSTVVAEPQSLVFHPETQALRASLVNRGNSPVSLGSLELTGADKQAFKLAQDPGAPVPAQLFPGERTTVTVQVDAKQFIQFAEDGEAEGFRPGHGGVRLLVNERPQAIPLKFEAPSVWSLYVIPALVKVLILVMLFIMPVASLLTWMERKQSAMMQDRLGPNMAGIKIGSVNIRLWGLLHIAADGLKMLFKEDFIPRHAHRALFTLAPLMAFIPALVVFAIVPFGDGLCYDQLFSVVSQADVDQCVAGRGGTVLQIAHLDVGLLFYFAIASLSAYGATLAGWASYNKFAVLGALRAAAQMISYEVAIGLTIVGALMVYGSLEPHALVKAQLASHWGVILQPIALILYFTAAIAETKRAPFDLPEGESEIVGYFLEYSGMRFGLFFLGEFIEIVFVSAMVATLFLGGWSLPFGMLTASGFSSPLAAQAFFFGGGLVLTLVGMGAWRANKSAQVFAIILFLVAAVHITLGLYSLMTGFGTALPHIAVVKIEMLTWGIKVLGLCWLQLLIRWTLPRFRYDQLMDLGWKGLLPLSLANIIITAIVMYFLRS